LVAVFGFVLGLAGCAAMAVVEWGAWTMVLPSRKLSAAMPDRTLGELIEVRADDGIRLVGAWHPAESPKGRTIVLLHGFADPMSLQGRVELLARHGWNVAVLDSRGHGQSEGDRTSFGGREAGD